MSIYGVGPFGNMMDSFLHPEEGYRQAGREIENTYGQARNFLMPYQTAGLNQIPQLQGAEDYLLNPVKMENDWASSYNASPYAQQLKAEALQSGLQSASQQGLLGSSAALQNSQASAANIMQSQRQQYMNDLIQKYLAGIGVGQNIFGTGAGAGSQLANGVLQTGQNLAQTTFGTKNAPGELLQKIIGTVVGAMSGTGGGFAGGGGGGSTPAYMFKDAGVRGF